MDAARAISLVVERIRSDRLDHPTEDLTAARFEGGWCVYAPAVIADDDRDPWMDPDDPVTRSVFLVDGPGRVEVLTSDAPAAEARPWFEEACVWFTAGQRPEDRQSFADAPPHPDLGGSSRPRRPRNAYDQQALDALARALTHERDFAGWLADRLRELADLLGGSGRLVARHPSAWTARHVTGLAEPDEADPDRTEEDATGVWRTWPAVDPADLPDTDTTGWLLVPCVAACEYLETLEPETDAATRLADVIATRAQDAPPWRSCGVAELLPQLVAVRRDDQVDADLRTLRQRESGLALLPAPDDADVEALLRIAVDAGQRGRDVIDVDASATAAYRRVLHRLELPFENYWYEAMFE